jgi:hypothetical protein
MAIFMSFGGTASGTPMTSRLRQVQCSRRAIRGSVAHILAVHSVKQTTNGVIGDIVAAIQRYKDHLGTLDVTGLLASSSFRSHS